MITALIDYIDEIGETMDVLVLGGYYGEGRLRSGDVSKFLLGVMDSNAVSAEDGKKV